MFTCIISLRAFPFTSSSTSKNQHYRLNNPLDVTKTRGKEAYNNLRIFIDCGDDDFLTTDNARLHIHLTDMEIKHEFRMRDGQHN